MKKIIMVLLVTCLLTGCRDISVDAQTETIVEVSTEATEEEIIIEEVDLNNPLDGYDRYSKEYIDELFMNGNCPATLNEWRELEAQGYNDAEIEYILLRNYGLIG